MTPSLRPPPVGPSPASPARDAARAVTCADPALDLGSSLRALVLQRRLPDSHSCVGCVLTLQILPLGNCPARCRLPCGALRAFSAELLAPARFPTLKRAEIPRFREWEPERACAASAPRRVFLRESRSYFAGG